MFQSKSFWKRIIGECDEIETVKTWDLSCFDLAWQEWLNTKNEYAMGDLQYYERIIKPYTTLIGIMVKMR